MISKNKLRQLCSLYPTTDDRDIAKILKVPVWVVRKSAEELGLEKQSSGWSSLDIEYLENYYSQHSNERIAESIGKSKMEVEHQAYRLGLQKNDQYFANIYVTKEETELLKQWNEAYSLKEYGNSRGNYLMEKILRHMYPNYKIFTEHPIAELRIDVYVHNLKIGFEFHGVQHKEFSAFFHGNKYNFRISQERDMRKSELCESLGIGLVIFYDDEEVSFGLMRAKINEVI